MYGHGPSTADAVPRPVRQPRCLAIASVEVEHHRFAHAGWTGEDDCPASACVSALEPFADLVTDVAPPD